MKLATSLAASLFAVTAATGCGSVEEPTPASGTDDTGAAPDPGSIVSAALAVTCADILDAKPGAQDGDYTLYADADPAKPWKAYCHDMASGTPEEFLTLAQVDYPYNFSSYGEGGIIAGGTTVHTFYQRVRIDPLSFVVDIGDETFSHSDGMLEHPDATPIEVHSMPFAIAMSCGGTGVANVDLTGTAFALDDTFAFGGTTTSGDTILAPDGKSVTLSGTGWCGWNGPKNAPFNPFNQMTAPALQLKYQP